MKTKSLNGVQLLEYQPNRYPFLMIDYVTKVIPGKEAKGFKNFTNNEWFFPIHFPGHPNVPGALQLEALAQSGCDPLSRTCRFMLTEEAHHMFVGENGVRRVIKKTCQMMNKAGISDPFDIDKIRQLGVIDLPTIQKKINLHYSF